MPDESFTGVRSVTCDPNRMTCELNGPRMSETTLEGVEDAALGAGDLFWEGGVAIAEFDRSKECSWDEIGGRLSCFPRR